jgi:hypothetical protein
MTLINKIINKLSSKRTIFHSEDDFKFEFAMAIKNQYPEAAIRLEKPFEITMDDTKKRVYFDIYFKLEEFEYVIELKYKTTLIDKKEMIETKEEAFYLKHHGADDITRYAIRKDIYRVEQFVNQKEKRKGFVIFLTNDPVYSKVISNKKNLNKNLSLYNGFIIEKKIDCWNRTEEQMNNPKHFTKSKELSYQLNLRNEYEVKWENYSNVLNSEFRYLFFNINN